MPDTKIIATLGPASWDSGSIAALHEAGADVFRINCSHSSSQEIAELVTRVRAAAPRAGVLVDLQGPKLRLGEFSGEISAGMQLTLGRGAGIPVNFDPLELGILPGHRILINDGRVALEVEESHARHVVARVVGGGVLSSRKGVNLPDTMVRTSPLTDKDRADAAAALAAGCDWLALSFVQHPQDVVALRQLAGPDVKVLAKVERPQVLEHLDELCQVADGVMAARGDLGVELPFERVPLIQREIVQSALRQGALSVCATEMLESMITASRPTRAEANDVATAVRDGFDAVMLSAETATGHDPVAAVAAMALLVRTYGQERVNSPFANEHPSLAAVTAAAAALASRIEARSILSLTYTGYSASLLAACRPPANIIAVSPQARVCRQLQLRHSVSTICVERPDDLNAASALALRHAVDAGLVLPGELVVMCASRLSARSDADSVWIEHAPA
jgi:pyruvate kinase